MENGGLIEVYNQLQGLAEVGISGSTTLNQVNVQIPINEDLNNSAKHDKPSDTSMLERSADTRALKPTSALSGASSTHMRQILNHKKTENSAESRKKKSAVQIMAPPCISHF